MNNQAREIIEELIDVTDQILQESLTGDGVISPANIDRYTTVKQEYFEVSKEIDKMEQEAEQTERIFWDDKKRV